MLSLCGNATNAPPPVDDSERREALLSQAQAAGFPEVKIGPGVYAGGDVRGWSRFVLAAREQELRGAEVALNP